MNHPFRLFATRRFLPLFITQFFGAFNDNAFKNAFLIWFTYDITSAYGLDAPMMITVAAGLFILPFFLFSATAGQLADKYEKAWLTRNIKLVEIILMVACAFFFYFQSIGGLLAVLFLMGMHSTFFGPIKYSLLPEHLKEHELISGNGFIEGGTFLAILLGTLFGGLMIRTGNGILVFSACVILFAVTGWISSRFIPGSPVGEPGLRIRWNIPAESWKILRYAQKERTVWLSIIAISWFWLIGATFLTQFPVYVKEVIGGEEQLVTLFLTVFSVGIGIGSLFCNRLLKGRINGRLVPYGSIGMTLAILLFTFASYHYPQSGEVLTLAAFFLSGWAGLLILCSLLMLSVSAGIYIVPLYAIMQHRSDDRYIARVIAANNVMNALFMVLASLAALGLYALGLHVTEILLATGIANIAVFFVIRNIVNRRLKHA